MTSLVVSHRLVARQSQRVVQTREVNNSLSPGARAAIAIVVPIVVFSFLAFVLWWRHHNKMLNSRDYVYRNFHGKLVKVPREQAQHYDWDPHHRAYLGGYRQHGHPFWGYEPHYDRFGQYQHYKPPKPGHDGHSEFDSKNGGWQPQNIRHRPRVQGEKLLGPAHKDPTRAPFAAAAHAAGLGAHLPSHHPMAHPFGGGAAGEVPPLMPGEDIVGHVRPGVELGARHAFPPHNHEEATAWHEYAMIFDSIMKTEFLAGAPSHLHSDGFSYTDPCHNDGGFLPARVHVSREKLKEALGYPAVGPAAPGFVRVPLHDGYVNPDPALLTFDEYLRIKDVRIPNAAIDFLGKSSEESDDPNPGKSHPSWTSLFYTMDSLFSRNPTKILKEHAEPMMQGLVPGSRTLEALEKYRDFVKHWIIATPKFLMYADPKHDLMDRTHMWEEMIRSLGFASSPHAKKTIDKYIVR